MPHSVTLLVYDLSQGMARMISRQLTGRQIDGIWHTSVVIHGQEWYFGQGVFSTTPGVHHYGAPVQRVPMGETEISRELFREFIDEIRPRFTAVHYHLLNHNCNTFSNEVCQFLVGRSIPSYITNLPGDFLETPFGQALRPVIDSFFSSPHAQPVRAPPATTTAPAPARVAVPAAGPPGHPHVALSLPELRAIFDQPHWHSASSPKMWEKLESVLDHTLTNVDPTEESAAAVAARLRKTCAGANAEADPRTLRLLCSLLREVDKDDERWVIVDVARLFAQAESYASGLKEAVFAVIRRELAGASPAKPVHLALLRAASNLLGHTKVVRWSLGSAAAGDRRTLLTSLLVSGLLHEPAVADASIIRAAAVLAFHVARWRFQLARTTPAADWTTVWSSDGADEEWTVEIVGAIAHVLGTQVRGNEEEASAMGTQLYASLCGLLFTAPPAILDLLEALECTPESFAKLGRVVEESVALFAPVD
ncbi:hypothetical protein H9P43_003493 [Blastocladiella emersonii ATCC 22665]|nr:hypothetical protein H9P43_003493 [Blastocladiella emersonii ATCC 22665]